MKLLLMAIYVFSFQLSWCQRGDISTRDSLKFFTFKLVKKALSKKKFSKLVVWDFTNPQQKSNGVATYIAEQLSIYATEIDSIIVLDRQNLETIIKEHKLKDKDFLIDQQALLQIGKFAGTEMIIVGKVSVFENECTVQLNLKIVDVNTAHALAAAEEYIPIDERFADVSGMALNCKGLDKTSPEKPHKGFGRPTETNENYNNPQQLKEEGCVESNTGMCCFFNTTGQDLYVVVYKTPLKNKTEWNDLFYGPKEEFKIKPQESKCVYSLTAGNSYRFTVVLDNSNTKNTTDYFDYGGILIEKCKSKTYTIKNAVITETKKVTNKLLKEVTTTLLEKGVNIIREKIKIKSNE